LSSDLCTLTVLTDKYALHIECVRSHVRCAWLSNLSRSRACSYSSRYGDIMVQVITGASQNSRPHPTTQLASESSMHAIRLVGAATQGACSTASMLTFPDRARVNFLAGATVRRSDRRPHESWQSCPGTSALVTPSCMKYEHDGRQTRCPGKIVW
jgi:hypothetical protein